MAGWSESVTRVRLSARAFFRPIRGRWRSGRLSTNRSDLGISPLIQRASRSFHGPAVNHGLEFEPGVKVAYSFTKKIAGGFEYYAENGRLTSFDPIGEQQQQIVPTIDLDLSPDWEFNFGVGVGMTGGTDHLLIKMILGRRFNFFHIK